MKKIIIVLASLVLFAGVASAQDMAQATETYNNGAAALQEGNKAQALELFLQALEEGQACGEDGAELVDNCKGIIPTIKLSIARIISRIPSLIPLSRLSLRLSRQERNMARTRL